MPLAPTAIVLSDVTMSFDGRELFRGLSFTFSSTTSYAIVGPSGSGKTTLLALAGALLRPTRGAVTYRRGDRPIPPDELTRSWITQTTNSIGARSALDNVAIGLMGREGSWRRARAGAHAMLESLGIGHLAHRRCRELSGGELQRVAVGRALVGRPDFVLADEPTGQLDQVTSTAIAEAIVARRGNSGVLVATHDHQVAAACEVVLRIGDGTLEIVRRP